MFRRSSSSAKVSNMIDQNHTSTMTASQSERNSPAGENGASVPTPPTRARPTRSMSRSSSLNNIFKRKDKETERYNPSNTEDVAQNASRGKERRSARASSVSRPGGAPTQDNANGAVEEKTYYNGVEQLGSKVGRDGLSALGKEQAGSAASNDPFAGGRMDGEFQAGIEQGSRAPEEIGGGKRKMSIGHKTRHRLSSMFSKDKDRSPRTDRSRSGSIASTTSNSNSSGFPPLVPPMPINHTYPGSGLDGGEESRANSNGMPSPSVSTKMRKPPPAPSSGSGTATPTKGYAGGGIGAFGGSGSSSVSSTTGNGSSPLALGNPILGVGTTPEPESLDHKLENLQDNTNSSSILTDSTPPSPTARSNLTSSIGNGHSRPSRDRSGSLYSQWSYDFEADEDDSDGEVFLTPPEGLSEVEEEDEEEEIKRDKHILAVNGIGAEGPNRSGRSNGADQGGVVSSLSRDSGVAVDQPASWDATKSAPTAIRTESIPMIHRAASVSSAGVSVRTRSQAARSDDLPRLDQAPILDSDIAETKHILELFLTSRMKEAEAIVYDHDPTGQHMYIQNAGAVIQCIKGMMTFDAEDLKEALEISRGTSALAASFRKPQGSVVGRFAGMVRGGTGTAHVKAMTRVELHAELIYAESLLIKAVLGIVAGGDWVGLIKEALNMRAAHGIYRTLSAYQDEVEASGSSELDEDFKSGVELGTGLSSLMLSLLPGKVLKLAEMFGYAGDRKQALATLMSAGGWRSDRDEPTHGAERDGIRRPICDMALLTFHLVISVLMPISGVDIPMAKKILDYNMERFPDGVFFMYFQSRLYTTRGQPEMAQKQLETALQLKLEYLQLQHMCLWDMGVNSVMLGQLKRADECFRILGAESSWSKAVYMYAQAACLSELKESTGESLDDARLNRMMSDVPKSMKKIAGKSLPIEKFVSRKARKFIGQDDRLMLAATELGYFFGALSNTPPRILYSATIPRIRRQVDMVKASSPDGYTHGADAYYDDLALALFLDGAAHSFAGFPHVEAIITEEDLATYPMSAQEAGARSEASLLAVLEHGTRVKLDHWIIYHAHFELGRLYSHLGNNQEAKRHLELVLSGRPLEVSPVAKNQGKYSMESALMIKAHAGLSTIKENESAKMR